MLRALEGIRVKQKGKAKQEKTLFQSRIDSKYICDFNLISLFIHLFIEQELHYAALGLFIW